MHNNYILLIYEDFMIDKNYLLNKIVEEISMSDNEMERIKNKVQTLINEISNSFGLKTITHTYIGSYAFKTIVNYDDSKIDIDCMLIFSKEKKSEYNLRYRLQEILNKYANSLIRDVKVTSKEKEVIQVKFLFKDEMNNYHIDFPITYDADDGRHLILENGNEEITEAHKISEDFKNVFGNDTNKLKFHHSVIKLFKRWVKTNIKDELAKIPSIAILQSCIMSNNNHSNILTNLKNNAALIYNELNNKNQFNLKLQPKNNIFYKKDIDLVKSRLQTFWNQMSELEQINDEEKFIRTSRKFFLGKNDNNDSQYGDKTSGA